MYNIFLRLETCMSVLFTNRCLSWLYNEQEILIVHEAQPVNEVCMLFNIKYCICTVYLLGGYLT